MSNKTGLFWFNNDLRLHDNAALWQAASSVEQLICIYCYQPRWQQANRYGLLDLGRHRQLFLEQSLIELEKRLASIGQRLLIIDAAPESAIGELISAFDVNAVFSSRQFGWYENQSWQLLQTRHPNIAFTETDTETLFSFESLPFTLNELPISFSKFRKIAEKHLQAEPPIAELNHLPKPPTNIAQIETRRLSSKDEVSPLSSDTSSNFTGGEYAAIEHLNQYFASKAPASYKETRNSLDGWSTSTKFSPWLANGSLSVRELAHYLMEYESNVIRNSSTYWIYFELLWREYFHWYALAYKKKLFRFSGLRDNGPLTSYYPERFRKWCDGNTPYPIVNACMHELNATGYMSNRGRQIVASCLVNELSLDWRYGAAYFEQQLLDYDVGSNWANWQYLAGVGADAKDKRHFNLDKQTEIFDPDASFCEKWSAYPSSSQLDSVDAADWPIEP